MYKMLRWNSWLLTVIVASHETETGTIPKGSPCKRSVIEMLFLIGWEKVVYRYYSLLFLASLVSPSVHICFTLHMYKMLRWNSWLLTVIVTSHETETEGRFPRNVRDFLPCKRSVIEVLSLTGWEKVIYRYYSLLFLASLLSWVFQARRKLQM